MDITSIKKVYSLPSSLTHLTFGGKFNQKVENLPFNLKEIKINKYKINLLKKIPFGCKIVDEYNKEIFM